MVTRYGMSDLGPIVFDESEEHPYLGRDMQKARLHSDKTAQKVDEEVERIIKECNEKAEKLISDNRDKLDLLAKTLLEKETLQAEEVYALLGIEPRQTHSWKPVS
jgi:cell division protease FtsH